MTWTLGFESGVNNDAITTANTGADSLFTNGGTGVISTAQAFAGTRSALLTNSTTNGILCVVKNLTAAGTLTLDLYFYWTALPSAEATLVRVLDTAAATCWSINTDSSGRIRYRDAAGTLVTISSAGGTSMSTAQWSHLKVTATAGATAGTMRVQYYVGASGTTSYDSGALTAQNTGTNWGSARIGTKAATSTATGTAYLDAVTGDESAVITSSGVTLAVASATGTAVPTDADAETLVGPIGPATGTGSAVPLSVVPDVSAALRAATGTGRGYAVQQASTPILSATADATNSPPRVLLSVGAASGSTVTIRRVDAQGNSVAVRSANPATLASGGWVGYDYEAPYNQTVTYTATTDVSTAKALSTTVELDVDASWLIHPGIPTLSVPLEITQTPTVTRPSGRGLYAVLGRPEAVARSDGTRKARSFDITARTKTAAQEDALDTLLDDDTVLLLQVAHSATYRPLYAWVSVGDVVRDPLTTFMDGRWTWTLPCVEAARPSGLLQSQRTWADVVAQNASWADVVAKYATWRDLITDSPVGA